jgi:hypothetical protein
MNGFDGINLIMLISAVAIVVLMIKIIRHDTAMANQLRHEIEAARTAARGEVLSEVADVADEYEPRSRDAICSAIWTVKQRDRVRAASCAVCAQDE